MLLIVAHHYVVNSGLWWNTIELQPSLVFVSGMWGKKAGFNRFMLITGYFMCKSKNTFRKFLKLLLTVESYNIIINLSFVLLGYTSFKLKEWLVIL